MPRLALALTLAFAALPALHAQPAPGFDPDTVQAGLLDGGKMWLFEDPPTEYLAETYGLRPDAAWYERARLASLRMPGCSASFVSPHGLVATNHHCGQGSVIKVSQDGEGLLDAGFYARSLDEERPVPDLYMDQLIAIEDVTDEVFGLTSSGTPADSARAQVGRRVDGERGEGFEVQVVPLYNGGRHSAYVFKRYTDVRLVMAPERALGYFGGDFDNFTYPRYALDFSFFRIYSDDGEPLDSPHYFPLAEEGVAEGDLIFVIGNPGSTSRGLTVAQLETTRDLQVPTILRLLDTRIDALQEYLATGPENPDAVRGQLFGLLNAQKAYRGRRDALADPYILARRAAAERAFAERSPEAADLVHQMETVQRQRQAVGPAYRAFAVLFNNSYGATTLLRARDAYNALDAAGRGEALDLQAVLDRADRPGDLERAYLTADVATLRAYFVETGQPLPAVLQGSTDAEVADRLIETSVLSSGEKATRMVEGITADDPAVQLYAALTDDYAAFGQTLGELGAQEDALAEALGRARFGAYGNTVPPDATFSLRFTDGIVKGYEFNGTFAAPFTTLYGIYDHYYSYCEAGGGIVTTGIGCDWELPERWLEASDDVDRSTPVNFVSTSDTIGGNSGSPAVNEDLELVGLNFDRTIEGLVRDYLYLPDRGRNVMVDVRVILEALDEVYDLDALADELTDGTLRE